MNGWEWPDAHFVGNSRRDKRILSAISAAAGTARSRQRSPLLPGSALYLEITAGQDSDRVQSQRRVINFDLVHHPGKRTVDGRRIDRLILASPRRFHNRAEGDRFVRVDPVGPRVPHFDAVEIEFQGFVPVLRLGIRG